jgi:hypothetical protein
MVDGVPTETPPHVVGAVMTFAATGLGLIVFSRRMVADPRWHDLATYTMYSGIAVLLLFVTVGFLPSMTVHRCMHGPASSNECSVVCGSRA